LACGGSMTASSFFGVDIPRFFRSEIRAISSTAPAAASMFDRHSLAASRCWPQKT
jgi:hypothetical protein